MVQCQLTISIEKTKYMILKTSQKSLHLEGCICIGSTPIEGVLSAINLGVSIDHSLTWKSHIEKMKNIISPKVGIISRIRHDVPKYILILLYNSLNSPTLVTVSKSRKTLTQLPSIHFSVYKRRLSNS